MAENKKYYYLKLKDNFFDTEEMIILESMQDGYKYSNILLKLYLRSLKGDGRLMFNNKIPYNSNMLAQITRHSVGDIEKAMKIFKDLDLIEILDNGAIYMSDIQNFIGKSTTEADRKRAYRQSIENEKNNTKLITQNGQMSRQMSDKSTPEIEIEIEKELEIDNKKSKDFYVIPDDEVIKLWNSLSLQKLVSITGTRKKLLNARLKEYGKDNFIKAIENIRQSSFLQGQNKGWIITFDWFIKPNNFVKVLENNYADKQQDKKTTNTATDKPVPKFNVKMKDWQPEHLTQEQLDELGII